MSLAEGVDALDKKEDLGTGPAATADRWRREIQAAKKGPYKTWKSRANKAIKRYRDEDPNASESGPRRRNAQFNVLWSNVQITLPAIYSRPPVPISERRYLDKDIVARAAATMLQRSLAYQVEVSQFHETMRQCRIDYTLAAWCSAWVRYSPTFQQDDGTPPMQGDPGKKPGPDEAPDFGSMRVLDETVIIDYSHWSDELVSTGRYWQEIRWRARGASFTRKQLIKTFGEEKGRRVPLNLSSLGKGERVTDTQKEVLGRAYVWQIWDLEERKTIWFCEEFEDDILKEAPDLLTLRNFTPSARPARGTSTNDAIWPIPDYEIWYDQGRELDSLTARIAALTRAIKACGVFDQSIPEIERLLSEGMENKLIGTANWASLSQKGGLEGAVSFLPIKEFADALIALYNARTQVKQDLYEISGTSDILRGATNPNETASAQKLKAQYSSGRLADRREEFNRFVKDTLVIMGEVICEWFSADTIWQMCDFEQWAKEQDLRAWAAERFPAPPDAMMGHNGGPPLTDVTPAPMVPPQQAAMPVPGPGAASGLLDAAPAPIMGEPPAGLSSPAPAGGPVISGPSAGAAPPIATESAPAPAGPPQPPVPGISPQQAARELFKEALQLLRNDKLRSFRIDVETDSTIQPDVQEEKQSRVEFITAVTQFLAQASEMSVAYPQLMPVLGKFLLFGARGFRVGRELESSLESLIADLERQARNPPPPKPDPEMVKAQSAMQLAQQKGDLEREKMQGQMAMQAQQHQLEQQKLQMEMQGLREKLQMELQKMQAELEALREKNALQAQQGQIKTAQAQQEATIKLQTAEQEGVMKERQMESQLAHDEQRMAAETEHGEQKHEMAMEMAETKNKAAAKAAAKPAKAA